MRLSDILLFVAEMSAAAALPFSPALETRQTVAVIKEASFNVEMGLGREVLLNIVYPAGTNGAIMVEYQNTKDRVLLTSTNRVPAAAPTGYVALEPVSYRMTMDGRQGGGNVDLLKLDYILNASKVGTLDISRGIVAQMDGAGSFVAFADGDLTFVQNADRTMLSLDLGRKGDLTGEWGFFIPRADAVAGGLITA